MGVPEKIGSDVPNFVKDVSWVPKCFSRCASAPKRFLMGSRIKLWTIHICMGVPKVIRSDVPNLMKDVPNFVKDLPRVPKCVSRWGSAPKHL